MKIKKREGVIICFCQIGTEILLIGKRHKTYDSLKKQIHTTKRGNTDIIGAYPAAKTYNNQAKKD